MVYRLGLALADALAALCAITGCLIAQDGHAALPMLAAVPLIIVISKLAGGYERDELGFGHSTLDEAPALCQIATMYSLIVWLGYGMLRLSSARIGQLPVLWLGLIVLVLLFRSIARVVFRFVVAPERCLLVGDASGCDWLQTRLSRQASGQLLVAGRLEPTRFSVHVLRAYGGVDHVIVGPGRNDGGVSGLVRSCRTEGVKVSVVPRVLEAVGCASARLADVEGVTLLTMAPARFTSFSRAIKRLMDVVGASLMLLFLAPLGAVIALAITLDSRGGVFFRQPRIGRGGERFRIFKFRTMVADADSQKHELRHLNEADGLFKIAEDPRITRAGRFLRRTSLDEVPQLLNVLRGDMSLVGPRPLVPEEDERVEGWHRRRLQLTPGMTGHWQILGSARIPFEDMVRIDYLYVTNWSLWVDVKILLRTIPYVLARKGM
jgi:exopolysaccharide biosynthesis polyprenyl glycosylphosphotransferase